LSSRIIEELSPELGVAWNDDLWSRFMEEFWERKPTRLPMFQSGPMASLAELFELVVSMRGSRRLPADRLWIARREPPRDRTEDFFQASLDLMGPQPADGDFDGFFRRLGKRIGGANIHRLQNHKPIFLERISELIARLEELYSPSIQRWDLDTFFGNYSITPFGAHRDQASVFSFCLLGERTYCTWPPDYPWNPDALYTPDPDRLAKHLEKAERFNVKAGQLFYWPSNRWHLVSTKGEPSVVVQVSSYLKNSK